MNLESQSNGACGTNLNNECGAVYNATVDGAFAHDYPKVQSFLALEGQDAVSIQTAKTSTCAHRPLHGTCSNTAVSCDDANTCTDDNCDPANSLGAPMTT